MYQGTVGRKVTALCSDSTVRTATLTGEPDTYFTVPARVTVKGRTVTGFVATWNDIFVYPGVTAPEGFAEYQFFPRRDFRNGDALPEWGKPELTPD